ncbi:MAG: Holliday junction resolvase RuvX [Deltaproteobacteria bacterium]|nr:Holliday junction resolvase RuvX [Deltaproteobacteria bacterium]
MILIGVDWGERRVGLAIWDDPQLDARPLDTLEVTPESCVARVARRVLSESPSALVVGLPLRLDGREGPSSRSARKFAAALAAKTKLPVHLQDERFTTSQAHTHRVAAGAWGREGVDAQAAAILVQTWASAQGLTRRLTCLDEAQMDDE